MNQPPPENTVRAYVDGVEIDKIVPPPDFLATAGDDWVQPFADWVARHHPRKWVHVILTEDTPDGMLREIWVGDMPPERPAILGGVVKTMRWGPRGQN